MEVAGALTGGDWSTTGTATRGEAGDGAGRLDGDARTARRRGEDDAAEACTERRPKRAEGSGGRPAAGSGGGAGGEGRPTAGGEGQPDGVFCSSRWSLEE